MYATPVRRSVLLLLALLVLPATALAQGTAEDYRRAYGLAARYDGLVTNVVEDVQWIGETNRFAFRRSVPGGHEFLVMDAETGQERAAFDHERLAAAIAAATGGNYGATTLPFEDFRFNDREDAIDLEVEGIGYRCTFVDYRCAERPAERRGFGGFEGETPVVPATSDPVPSPDGRLEALVHNYNLVVRRADTGEELLRTQDGSEHNHYAGRSIAWAPDSRRLAAYRVIPGYTRLVHYVESSPESQLQPLHHVNRYTKPGDVLDVEQPVLFDLDRGRQVIVDRALFPNAYSVSALEWREDGREVTFEYNHRGHTLYRIIGIDGEGNGFGEPRVVLDEDPETFFYYRTTDGGGKKFRHDLDDGREIIWMSERDGWSHLYLFDGRTGRIKNQITKGDWLVRDVLHVDEENRQIYFAAGGVNPGQDPYFVQFYRIDFDGTDMVPLTEANGTHTISFSPDMRYYVTSWSRVDLPHVTQLRRTADRSVIAEIGRGDHSALLEAGWIPPEPFVAKGRDGTTDIYGIIIRPSNFDPSKEYAVIESIYAGPHSNHVPKSFSVLPSRGMMQQAELGFIVAQIDGMGTSNRSKAFHDVAWKNLKDAGFPDRILWHKAVAAKYPWYDVDRVGIYGGSAGGQNAMGALLFHGDFYDAAVADNGCHDNRMDKIWWNELWMSWPLGPHYSASSNVDNAWRLQGKLLLTLSELDTNVDPSSTFQVVDALLAAGKDFDFLFVPGAGHARGPHQERKRYDFFVENLLHVDPPAWNQGGIAVTEDR